MLGMPVLLQAVVKLVHGAPHTAENPEECKLLHFPFFKNEALDMHNGGPKYLRCKNFEFADPKP